MTDLFKLNVSSGDLVIRAVTVYLAVLILLRLGGKRQIGQMSPTEFVAVLLISNAVQNAMNAGDNSLLGGLILAAVIISLSTLISYLTYRSIHFRNVFEGTPTLLIHGNKLISKNLHKERLSESELLTRIRQQGFNHVSEISTGILEADGTLTLIRNDQSISEK